MVIVQMTMGATSEQVLVLPRADVPRGCRFTGVRLAGPALMGELALAVRENGRYLPRPLAEESPDWKQLIPYVVVRDGPMTFLMERSAAGGDQRLHGKASIGVGGHLNPVDEGEDPLMTGLQREWAEELDTDWNPEFQLVGLLNDDSNPVGAVHLGVVFVVEARGRAVAVREVEKLSGHMATHEEILSAWDRLETWSQLVASEILGLTPGTVSGAAAD